MVSAPVKLAGGIAVGRMSGLLGVEEVDVVFTDVGRMTLGGVFIFLVDNTNTVTTTPTRMIAGRM